MAPDSTLQAEDYEDLAALAGRMAAQQEEIEQLSSQLNAANAKRADLARVGAGFAFLQSRFYCNELAILHAQSSSLQHAQAVLATVLSTATRTAVMRYTASRTYTSVDLVAAAAAFAGN